MKQQVLTFSLNILIGMILFATNASLVYATQASVMPFPLEQRFSPRDVNGDEGSYNCMAASVIMTLRTIALEQDIPLADAAVTYTSLRQEIRKTVAPDEGIPPHVLANTVSHMTSGRVSLHMIQLSEETWEPYVLQELSRGYPLIAHLSDREMVYGKTIPEDASHVIVIYGIDDKSVYFSDSWDGQTHKVSKETFANAWQSGEYAWWAFPLRVNTVSRIHTT